MEHNRRSFLKAAGFSALVGAWAIPVVNALGKAFKVGVRPEASKGGRWALIIDMRKCLKEKGCTACMDACHVGHNVPSISDKEEEIKWIWKAQYEHAFPEQLNEYTEDALKEQPVVVLCNHCDNPPCVRVCPTQATFQRPDGIVTMDMHRCVGCRYCIVGCPYGARSFNWSDPRKYLKSMHTDFPTRKQGVVEKCNFCAERLARGEDLACVEACRNIGANAMTYGDLADPNSEVRRILANTHTIRRKPGLGTKPHVFYVV